jgi:beta-1,4-mannosyl-glycoprotein beta-1,4-N-acetylglucosaminyltransferase
LDKIIHIVVDDTPDQFLDISRNLKPETTKDNICYNKILHSMFKYNHWNKSEMHWNRDFFHRENVLRGLVDCQDDDIIILSDLDEIPNIETLKNLIPNVEHNTFYHLMQNMYHYYANVRKNEVWFGSKVCRYSYIKNTESNFLRINKDIGKRVDDGGWHFSFFGGVEKVKVKVISWGHQEMNRPDVLNALEDNIRNNRDIFYRPDSYYDVNIETEYPEYLKNELKKFPTFFKT